MYTTIHSENGQLKVDIPQYLRRHDIVYKRPALKGYDGLPLGNGCAGGLLYHTANSLVLPLNHTDAIEFGKKPFKAWAWQNEEKNTAPFSCGEMQISSSLPLFDWVYLTEFEERLNLADGKLTGYAKTPVSELRYEMVFLHQGMLMLELDLHQEEAGLTIRLEKWGSPSFFHFYEQIVNAQDRRLEGTSAKISGSVAGVFHRAGNCRSAILAGAVGEEYTLSRLNSHAVELSFPPATHHHFTFFVRVEAGELGSEEDLLCQMEKVLCTAGEKKADLLSAHQAVWHGFWSKSFVHLGAGEEYLENLYYTHLYQLNCCCHGRYPITFAALWGWFKDSRNWGHYYHWNHQQTYWGLQYAGHEELARAGFQYRKQMLARAKKDARLLFGTKGAFYSDVSSLDGENAFEPDTVRNLTVAAQIGLDMYAYWQVNQDEVFFREYVLPMLLEAWKLYEGLLQKQEDGVYRIRGGATCYESYWNLKETLTDYAAIKKLIQVLQRLAKEAGLGEEALAKLEDVNTNLYSLPVEKVQSEAGETTIFACGRNWQGDAVPYGSGEYPHSPFTATLTAPVYPFGLAGLGSGEERLLKLARDTMRYYLKRDIYTPGPMGGSGHTPIPECLARLGMGEELQRLLHFFVDSYQHFPNGLMHFASKTKAEQFFGDVAPRVLEPVEEETQWNQVHDKAFGKRTTLPAEWFLHAYFEAHSNLFAGIIEMLLQSHDEIIRVFPAFASKENAVFKLRAAGGFEVTSECLEGKVRYIGLLHETGRECLVQNPWKGQAVGIDCASGEEALYEQGSILRIYCPAKQPVVLYASEFPPQNDYCNDFALVINPGEKRHGRCMLGLPPVFQ